MAPSSSSSPWEEAKRYVALGLSVIPIRRAKKSAAVSWKTYQQRLPADANHDLAESLPTVATARGRHVYARTREDIHTTHLGDGELRAEGAYVVAPPSLRPAGGEYRWLVPLCDVPLVELEASGLARRWTDAPPVHLEPGPVHLEPGVLSAVESTQPTGPGERRMMLFKLARRLKGVIPGAKEPELQVIVRNWHRRALQTIRTRPFGESWHDFAEAWQGVRYPVVPPAEVSVGEAVEERLAELANDVVDPRRLRQARDAMRDDVLRELAALGDKGMADGAAGILVDAVIAAGREGGEALAQAWDIVRRKHAEGTINVSAGALLTGLLRKRGVAVPKARSRGPPR